MWQAWQDFPGFIATNVIFSASVFGALGLTTLAVYPAFTFFRHGWLVKESDIESSFSATAKYLYLKTFLNESIEAKAMPSHADDKDRKELVDSTPTTTITEATAKAAGAEFKALYNKRYGRGRFVPPLILFTICCLAATYLLCQSAAAGIFVIHGKGLLPAGNLHHGIALYIIPDVAAAGLAGAYLWIVADMILSARRLIFAPADLLYATLRLAMSASIAVALVGTIGPKEGKWFALSLAFAIGAFPLSAIRTMLRRYGSNTLKLGGDDDSNDALLSLDGLDRRAADRLLEADISTVLQLAYADPVQLSIRTGLDFNVVTDLISQALAWLYLGDRLNDYRAAGLRGAMEIWYFLKQLQDPSSNIYKLMKKLLDGIPGLPQEPSPPAAASGPPPPKRAIDKAAFLNACDEIANDPYTKFLVALWQGDDRIPADVVPDYANLLT